VMATLMTWLSRLLSSRVRALETDLRQEQITARAHFRRWLQASGEVQRLTAEVQRLEEELQGRTAEGVISRG
jgi:hypothetical protein